MKDPSYTKERIRPWVVALFVAGLLVLIVVPMEVAACTVGVANGYITVDGRPVLVKVRDLGAIPRQQLVYVSGSPYNYLGVRSEGGSILTGLNEAGVASGNSLVRFSEEPASNSSFQRHILENYNTLDQIRNHIESEVNAGTCNASGCFPFIDAQGNAIMFEVNRSNWWLEYDSIDPDREAYGLLGFVVRANEFHERTDGTDDTSITGGRYESGTFNVSGLLDIDMLCARTVTQGNEGANVFEFARYGPGRTLASIARSTTVGVMVVHGVAPDEDPALTTLWLILGQPNYSIAVPVWVRVSNVPQCLASGDMYDRAGHTLENSAHTARTTTYSTKEETRTTLRSRWPQCEQGFPESARYGRLRIHKKGMQDAQGETSAECATFTKSFILSLAAVKYRRLSRLILASTDWLHALLERMLTTCQLAFS